MMSKPCNKNYPKEVPFNIDIPNITLSDLLKTTTENVDDRDALICQGQVLTYKEINDYSDLFAGYLQHKWGVTKGQHIAIMLPNLL